MGGGGSGRAGTVGPGSLARVRVCRLRVRLPPSAWAVPFSLRHPEALVEILSRTDLDARRSLTEVRLYMADLGEWRPELERLPLVEEVEPLGEGPSTAHFRVVHRTSGMVRVFRELHLERRFPFTIRAGEASWVVVATEPRIRTLIERLRKVAPSVVLESVRHTHLHRPTGPLTPRQADLLHQAITAGYFEIPRKVTLSELAERLGVAGSTLSEGLAVIEKKLVERWPEQGLVSAPSSAT